MAESQVQSTDQVLIKLTLRGRDSVTPFDLNTQVSVSDLGLKAGAKVPVPQFDTERFTELLVSNPDEAMKLHGEFANATAEYLASGQVPETESLARGVVAWVLETRPKGHKYTTTDDNDGYVISEDAINIAGPMEVGEERFWRVTAVGTWG